MMAHIFLFTLGKRSSTGKHNNNFWELLEFSVHRLQDGWCNIMSRWCKAAVPNLFSIRDQFCGRQFFHGPGWGEDGFRLIQAHYIYCVLYFYNYYIVIYNEIIIQLTIMQNQWEPWPCFPATRWSHLGVMGDSDTLSVLLMSSLLCKMQLNCHLPLTDRVFFFFKTSLLKYNCLTMVC